MRFPGIAIFNPFPWSSSVTIREIRGRKSFLFPCVGTLAIEQNLIGEDFRTKAHAAKKWQSDSDGWIQVSKAREDKAGGEAGGIVGNATKFLSATERCL